MSTRRTHSESARELLCQGRLRRRRAPLRALQRSGQQVMRALGEAWKDSWLNEAAYETPCEAEQNRSGACDLVTLRAGQILKSGWEV